MLKHVKPLMITLLSPIALCGALCGVLCAVPALADGPKSEQNRVGRMASLNQVAQDEGQIEFAHLASQLEKLDRLGIYVGPFCIQLKKACYTRKELSYVASEYFSAGGFELPKMGLYAGAWMERFRTKADTDRFRAVAEDNGLEELALFHAIGFKERLERAFLAHFKRLNPNTKDFLAGNMMHYHSWVIDENGEIKEKVVRNRWED